MNDTKICGRTPTFGDIEQIKEVKKERKRIEALRELESERKDLPEEAYTNIRVHKEFLEQIDEESLKDFVVDIDYSVTVVEERKESFTITAHDEDEAEELAKEKLYETESSDEVEIDHIEINDYKQIKLDK